jgi:hypothetical protein
LDGFSTGVGDIWYLCGGFPFDFNTVAFMILDLSHVPVHVAPGKGLSTLGFMYATIPCISRSQLCTLNNSVMSFAQEKCVASGLLSPRCTWFCILIIECNGYNRLPNSNVFGE